MPAWGLGPLLLPVEAAPAQPPAPAAAREPHPRRSLPLCSGLSAASPPGSEMGLPMAARILPNALPNTSRVPCSPQLSAGSGNAGSHLKGCEVRRLCSLLLVGAATSWHLLTALCFPPTAQSQASSALAPSATLQGRVGPAAALQLLPEHPHRAGPCGPAAADASVQW